MKPIEQINSNQKGMSLFLTVTGTKEEVEELMGTLNKLGWNGKKNQ
jgi:hypothetical protein